MSQALDAAAASRGTCCAAGDGLAGTLLGLGLLLACAVLPDELGLLKLLLPTELKLRSPPHAEWVGGGSGGKPASSDDWEWPLRLAECNVEEEEEDRENGGGAPAEKAEPGACIMA
jgi:hypothetical protein